MAKVLALICFGCFGKLVHAGVGKIWDIFFMGNIWDTVLGKIWEIVLGNIWEYVVAPVWRQFSYMCYFNSNIEELKMKLEDLRMTRQMVQLGVDDDHRQVRVIGPNVEAWLKSVNEVTSEVEGIIQQKPKVNEGCLKRWCPNVKLLYSLSSIALKKTEVVGDLQAAGVLYGKPSYNPPPECIKAVPNGDFMEFESRRLNIEEIIKALKHDEINLIGICGIGGAGKTTMVNEVARRAKEDNLFDEVAMAIVSENPNLTIVQVCIADMLGLKLGDRESPIVRASLLRQRILRDNKKILVILDDIWEEFDLQDMGIPLGDANKNFKMLYTSRIKDLWHDLRIKKEIPLELLSQDEAWQLFRKKAGDLADTPDLQPIAKLIAIACGCLPLTLVTIGSTLSKKGRGTFIKDIWEDMLNRLTSASSTLVDNRLSSSLERRRILS